MVQQTAKKRSPDSRLQRPSKKQKRRREYKSDSESDLDAVDEAAHVAQGADDEETDDGQDGDGDAGADKEEEGEDDDDNEENDKDEVDSGASDNEENDKDEVDSGASDGSDDDEAAEDEAGPGRKSKRNDPSVFAASISKILSTKLSSSKRADPVLSRSAVAHEASRALVDDALEAKVRRQAREEKRRALEKGRIKEVLVGAGDDETGPAPSTAEMLGAERRLRKMAQRGVVKLFNAVRTAQVKAAEAERLARQEGLVGVSRREEKVNEMSKKGFLELIASGGGQLKKGALEEA